MDRRTPNAERKHRLNREITAPQVRLNGPENEPLGIVNLEAMACGTAVVASNVGGIPEVVVDGETGVLVPYDAAATAAFEADLAAAVNDVAADKERAAEFGRAGRERAIRDFSWATIAAQTVDIYRSLI